MAAKWPHIFKWMLERGTITKLNTFSKMTIFIICLFSNCMEVKKPKKMIQKYLKKYKPKVKKANISNLPKFLKKCIKNE